MNLFKNIYNWWLKTFHSKCKKCNIGYIVFSHEEHFSPGSKNVYKCTHCNRYFI